MCPETLPSEPVTGHTASRGYVQGSYRSGTPARSLLVNIWSPLWLIADGCPQAPFELETSGEDLKLPMVTREILKEQILSHLDGTLTLEDLAAWAEDVFRTEDFEAPYEDVISDVLATIRDAIDPHRFRWEEPDFEDIIDDLERAVE
jgi:hypothetical protein